MVENSLGYQSKRILFVVGDGLGNQLETVPALKFCKRKYSCPIDVYCSVPNLPNIAKAIFSGLVDRLLFPQDQAQIDVSQYRGQILTLMCLDFPFPGMPVLNQPQNKIGSEVEFNLGAVGSDFQLGDFYCTLFEQVQPSEEKVDILVHNGYSKVSARAIEKWEPKSYPYFETLVGKMKDRGYSVGSIGGFDEQIKGTQDLTCKSLLETVSLMKSTKLLVCNDTGTYHLANMVGLHNVVLFAFTDLGKNYDKRFHRFSTVVRKDLPCSPCQFKLPGGEYWLESKDFCKWKCRELDPVQIIEVVEQVIPHKKNFVTAITTYNRLGYLRECLESWDKTRSKKHKWTLIVADDGSTDGTVEYLRGLSFQGVVIILLFHNRRGVHFQTNQILKMCSKLCFDFAFKTDDDIRYLEEGWDYAYYRAAMETGFHHLCFFDAKWLSVYCDGEVLKEEHIHESGLVSSRVHTTKILGAFWTFTKDVIRDVGYFDMENFGLCGFGHVDYTLRCGRAGYNNMPHVYDLYGSEHFIQLVTEQYRQAVAPDIRIKATNTDSEVTKKQRVMLEPRKFIPYNNIPINMDMQPLEEAK